ncbi:DUF6879 family protein [Streptomyces albidoflavus]|uniref:DUF6879 family protein n=1 Tax=Streptomyces TaxID=1883 RepID=UPI0004CDC75F|nr:MULTISPECIES: DUF6879 family protein [Streptomyces]ALM39099.1 hypothetical protein SFR_2484 [Streptomyces sp. FR-008]KAF0793124.1 hypothetical protein P405_30960 [Streptomyces sp. FR-008]RZE60840.1 hypothetical protein C0Q98_10825 [Streptomyces albidoflavus]WTB63169.1 hypothetical protein OIF23_10685 [Streptomyces albidoflavus]WTC29664.1 hypothetical protein OH749_10745 [Streptomyces albidoflavus]
MPSSVPSFAELLGQCERSAVHLELRASCVPTDPFAAWKRGERIDGENRASWWHPYDPLITDAVVRGVAVRGWLPRRRATSIAMKLCSAAFETVRERAVPHLLYEI